MADAGAAPEEQASGAVSGALASWYGHSAPPDNSMAPDLEQGRFAGEDLQEGFSSQRAVHGAAGELPAAANKPLRVSVHGVEGAICASAGAPFVRVHVVDARTGLWRERSAAPSLHAVYNLDAGGVPYLRTTPKRSEPWQADLSKGSQVLPFATLPCPVKQDRTATSSAPPLWNESFLLAEPPGSGTLVLLELLDAVVDKHVSDAQDESHNSIRCVTLGWAFLDLDHATAALPRTGRYRRRRLRLQLYRYRAQRRRKPRSSWFASTSASDDAAAAEDGDHGRRAPDVFLEFRGPERSLEPASGLSAVFSCGKRGFKRQPWPAVLEVSIEPVLDKCDLAGVAAGLDQSESMVSRAVAAGLDEQPTGITLNTTQAELMGLSSGAEDSGVEEPPNVLAPHNQRLDDEPSLFPDLLLWNMNSGKRGTYRLSMSPSGLLLAAAAARRGGSCDLRVFNVSTGKLHAVCTAAHDAFVYDLRWHAFSKGSRASAPPLLISCGGDSIVQIFEVPENPRKLASGVLRPHMRIKLPSHVYSVQPHPGLSADPAQIVLACGGHEFGLQIIKVVRHWHAGADEGSGRWVAAPSPWQETVHYKVAPLRVPGQTGGNDGERPRRSKEKSASGDRDRSQVEVSDVLCVCFSRQQTSPDNLFVTDVAGRIMLFQVRYDPSADAGRGGIRAVLVRVYSAPALIGVPIYGIEVVTPQLLQGKRLNHVLLSTVDDWVLLNSRDHVIRLVSLQRGVARVEVEMTGLECGTYPIRAAMSPDGAFVACGSESGELLGWNAVDGKQLPASVVPPVQLAGPVMDVVWSAHHHLVACCALDDQAPPVLVFVGGDPNRSLVPAKRKEQNLDRTRELPLRFVPLSDAPREELAMVQHGVAPIAASVRHWENQWTEATADCKHVGVDEKRRMKEQILAKLREEQDFNKTYASLRTLPGSF